MEHSCLQRGRRGDEDSSDDDKPLGLEEQQRQDEKGHNEDEGPGNLPVLSSAPVSPQYPPSLRSVSDTPTMTASSTPLGHINAARRPAARGAVTTGSSGLTQDIQAKMKAFSLSRQGAPVSGSSTPANKSPANPPQGALAGAINPSVPAKPSNSAPPDGGGRLPTQARPAPPSFPSAPSMSAGQGPPPVTPIAGGGLAAKRGLNRGMKLSDVVASADVGSGDRKSPGESSHMSTPNKAQGSHNDSAFTKYSDLIDTKAGTLHFKNKAVIHGGGIDFSSGRSFNISLDDVETLEELGKGNYGSVYKARHCKSPLRRPGLGLVGAVHSRQTPSQQLETLPAAEGGKAELSNVIMAMKEIRLELDDAKFAAIIMELDILHRCVSPFIIDFYGAFFQEGAVYICMEYMDGGSMEKLYANGIPDNILRKVAASTVMGLKALKDKHNIIHRDVKPTNILLNTRGQVKICDFGVSGNLVASIAKTNIGCQSYMAPERIAGGSSNPGGETYSVQSDIWSLGLTLVECARGVYPYPPETYNNIFSQLNAIVKGEAPQLPDEGFSDEAKDFVQSCLSKNPAMRPSYSKLIRHPWLASLMEPPKSDDGALPTVEEDKATPDGQDQKDPTTANYPDSPPLDIFDQEVADWVCERLDRKLNSHSTKVRPALHAVALDAIPDSPQFEDASTLSPE